MSLVHAQELHSSYPGLLHLDLQKLVQVGCSLTYWPFMSLPACSSAASRCLGRLHLVLQTLVQVSLS